MSDITEIATGLIKPQAIERDVNLERLEELVESIKAKGIIEPLVVTKAEGQFYLIAGKRRLEAAKRAGSTTVPCIVLEVDATEAISITLHENLYREDLNPIEEANAYIHMRDRLGMNNREIAKASGKKESYISQRLAILLWPQDLIDALRSDQINFSVARELSKAKTPKDLKYLLQFAIRDGANSRTVNLWVRNLIPQSSTPLSAGDDTSIPHPAATEYVTRVKCHWCGDEVPLDKAVNIFLCPRDYEALMSAREKKA